MEKDIKNVAILGAGGTVGSLVAGIIAQEGINVYLLSRTKQRAQKGLSRAIEQARSEVISRNIICGDYESLLKEALTKADWVIEAVTEKAEIKHQMYERLDGSLKPQAIISTTTSSLPLDELVSGRSDDFKKKFLSTHFYNPPARMPACEITGTHFTQPQIYNYMKDFLNRRLRRDIIEVENIAGFAGNRIAFLLFSEITDLVSSYGVEMMDYLIGPYTGRLMSPLATIDLIGLDIYAAIIDSIRKNTKDEMHDSFILPDYITKMIEKGLLGNKTRSGFYKKGEDGRMMFFDPSSFQYIDSREPNVDFVEQAKHLIHIGMYREDFDVIKSADCKEAQIVMNILCTYISYSYSRIGEVTRLEYGIDGIDRVMSGGYHWAPPSLILTMLGGSKVVRELLKQHSLAVPDWLEDVQDAAGAILKSGKFFVAH